MADPTVAADGTGTIDTALIWLWNGGNDTEVGIVELTSGDDLETMDWFLWGDVASGSQQTTACDLDVTTGEYIEGFGSSGNLERDSNSSELWYDVTPIPHGSVDFNLTSGPISLQGVGSGGTAHEKALSDTVTVADAIVKAVAQPQSDTMNIADAISKEPQLAKSDSMAIVDATPLKAIGQGLADSVAISDATPIKAMGQPQADSMAIADSIAKAVGQPQADTVTITDAQVKAIGVVQSDSVAIADSFDRAVAYVRGLADAMGITDAISKAMSIVLSDSMTITDVFSYVMGQAHTLALADTVVITDSMSALHCTKTFLRMQASRMDAARIAVSRMPLFRTICRRS